MHDQNILVDLPAKLIHLVCKRPQEQFQSNLCAVMVSKDFVTMSKIVYR